MEINKRKILISSVVIVIGLIVYGFRLWSNQKTKDTVIVKTETTMETTFQSESESSESELKEVKIPVYLCGAVKAPGIYVLDGPKYLYELIDMAGGLEEEAAFDRIDLVYYIDSSQSIYIPFSEDAKTEESRDWNDFYQMTGQDWSETKNTEEKSSGIVNINTAGKSELCMIPGVGEKTAESIIAYREEHGPFQKIEDIMNVSGIGKSKFEKCKSAICV